MNNNNFFKSFYERNNSKRHIQNLTTRIIYFYNYVQAIYSYNIYTYISI